MCDVGVPNQINVNGKYFKFITATLLKVFFRIKTEVLLQIRQIIVSKIDILYQTELRLCFKIVKLYTIYTSR